MLDNTENFYNASFTSSYRPDVTSAFPTKRTLSSSFIVPDDVSWDVPLREFVTFLSSIYGYDIMNKLGVYNGEGYDRLEV